MAAVWAWGFGEGFGLGSPEWQPCGGLGFGGLELLSPPGCSHHLSCAPASGAGGAGNGVPA